MKTIKKAIENAVVAAFSLNHNRMGMFEYQGNEYTVEIHPLGRGTCNVIVHKFEKDGVYSHVIDHAKVSTESVTKYVTYVINR